MTPVARPLDDDPVRLGDVKTWSSHAECLEDLHGMTPAEKFQKTCELTVYARSVLRQELREAFPDLSEVVIYKLYLERLKGSRKRSR
jgi:hypothetical protein